MKRIFMLLVLFSALIYSTPVILHLGYNNGVVTQLDAYESPNSPADDNFGEYAVYINGVYATNFSFATWVFKDSKVAFDSSGNQLTVPPSEQIISELSESEAFVVLPRASGGETLKITLNGTPVLEEKLKQPLKANDVLPVLTLSPCTSSLNCEEGMACLENLCQPIPCSLDSECPSDALCVSYYCTKSNATKPDCVSNSDCDANHSCVSGVCVPSSSGKGYSSLCAPALALFILPVLFVKSCISRQSVVRFPKL